ncbi:uncharacterized protein ASPGLDRAFT_62001 [Aspergillus glaucus CBS 516.65]|uniref:Uncharacterized protein n=1 Tax=Aspergillus glaucus CBS 516.65 TaxID=1160497 RepID=A0A1L9V5C8_ASPGL|nr:hypothetical protein ASPGLDRAFT_62001 [Aspergillus glaucus CBS 516.65]OJJ79135.1 hypothetical protein ASPGLDRAFT_62001 [Aspergillus glaucus CBS 516.65]
MVFAWDLVRPQFHAALCLHSSISPNKSLRNTSIIPPRPLQKKYLRLRRRPLSTITAIIDWQSASIEPAFWYSDEIPDFATGDEIYAHAFNLCSQFHTPTVSGPRLMDENLLRPFRYSYRMWKDGAVALRHELIETAQRWKQLGFAGGCLFALLLPSSKKLVDHEKEYRLFVAAQDLRRDLSGLLDTATDGWVPPEEWEGTKAAHRRLFNGALQEVLMTAKFDVDKPVTDEAILGSIWPSDI